MSMIGNYLCLPEEQLDAVLQAPSTILELLDSEADEAEYPDGPHLDIDKAWHAIHFLLTGDPWSGEPPLQNVVMGGAELGDEDVGYGPARYLTPEEVQAAASAIASISGEALWSRFDEQAFAAAEIYPQGWSQVDKDYLVEHYETLREFFSFAAAEGDAMIVYLS